MAALRIVKKLPCGMLNGLKGHVLKTSVKNVSVHSALRSAYDGDGRTVVSVINSEEDAPLMINSYSVLGFRLNNGCFVIGPLVIFPHSVLSWNIEDDHDINEKSLSLFLRLCPKPDVLLIGLSDQNDYKLISETKKNIKDMLGDKKPGERITVEVLSTEKAVSTFNFLNSEKRFVAAALLPPVKYSPTLDDQFRIEYLKRKEDHTGLIPSFSIDTK